MNVRGLLVIDLLVALVVAALVLILSPGLAITAILALLVLAACAVSFAISSLRGRRAGRRRLPGPGPIRGAGGPHRPQRRMLSVGNRTRGRWKRNLRG